MFACGPRGARLRWTRRSAARSLWLVFVAPLLAACTSVEIEDHSLQFNQATGSLGNRVMLLNVVRAAKGYPVQFSKVTSYSGQSRMDGGLNLNFPFIVDIIGKPGSIVTGSAAPSATFKTGVSQLQLADLNTGEIQKTLRKKVTANDFAYYRSQGWPKALVHTILIEEILVEPRLLEPLRKASEHACSDEGSGKRKHREACRWLRTPTIQGCSKDRDAREERASPDGDVVVAYPNNPRKRCQHENFQWFFAAIRVLPSASLDFDPKVDTDECTTPKARLKDIRGSAQDGKSKSKDAKGGGDGSKGASESVKEGKVSVDVNVKITEKADKDDDGSDKAKDGGSIGLNLPRDLSKLKIASLDELAALEHLRYEHLCLLKEGKTPIIISWRSPERMVRYLGEVLAVQGFGSGERKIIILNDDGYPVELFRVESGRDLLGRGSAVTVEGPERETFYIPIPERQLSDAHLSLQALALVMESVNLAVSGKELPRVPTLFLSGG